MASMQHRYSRGQSGSGQGSLPRPAWNSGNHGTRTASPEPGANVTPIAGGGDSTKGREDRPDEVIQLENEVSALTNACAAKDQRIADLQRVENSVGRLKRDIRQLNAELHATRKQLSQSVNDQEKLKSQPSSGKDRSASGQDEVVDSPSGGTGGSLGLDGVSILERERQNKELVERLNNVEEENRQLKEALAQSRIAQPAREPSNDNMLHTRQSSGASTQRVSDPPAHQMAGFRGTAPGMDARYAVGQHGFAGHAPPPLGGLVSQGGQREDVPRMSVYSTHLQDHSVTLGMTMVEGYGTVDGVSSVAKLVLQRCKSSVYCPQHQQQQQQQVGAYMAGANMNMARGQVLA